MRNPSGTVRTGHLGDFASGPGLCVVRRNLQGDAVKVHSEQPINDNGKGREPSDDAILSVTQISKTFGATVALDSVSFSVRRGAVHALLGGNGSGKSTLIKILAGVTQADQGGDIRIQGERIDASRITPEWARSVGLHFVHQAIGSFSDLSVAENFALGDTYSAAALGRVRWRRLHRNVRTLLDRFEVDVPTTARMGDLRPATQTMIAIARALQHEDEDGRGVLILDEPTASLPTEEVDLVLRAIEGYVRRGHTVVLVTHRINEVLAICTDATFLRDGMHQATRSLRGATEHEVVTWITGSENRGEAVETRSLSPGARLRVTGLAVGRLEGANLTVRGGEIVGISGLLGSGRSTLLRTVFGAHHPSAGLLEIDGAAFSPRNPGDAVRRGVAYVPEDRGRDSVFADRPLRENLSMPRISSYWRALRIERRDERTAATDAIRRYGIVAPSSESPISQLSGGNQQKAILARWLEMKPGVLLLDEPTQGVDVGARAAIHTLIRKAALSGCAVVVVTSDSAELATLCHRVIGLVGGRLRREIEGSAVTEAACLAIAYDDGESTTAPEPTRRGDEF